MVKSIFSLTTAETALRGAKFLFFLFLANHFGADDLGRYSTATALFALIFVLTDLGITKNITLALLKNRNLLGSIWLRLALFLFVGLWFVHDAFVATIFLLFLADALFEAVYAILRAKERFTQEARIKLTQTLLYFITIIAAFVLRLTLLQTFILLSLTIFSLALIHFLKHYRQTTAKLVLQPNWWLYIGSVMTILYFRADILIISYFLGDTPTGLYSAAAKIVEIGLILSSALGSVMLPKLANNQNGYFLPNLLTAFLVTLLFYIFSPFIMDLLYHSSYQSTTPIARILSFALFPIILNNYFFTLFLARSKEAYYAFITSFMALGNLFGNLIVVELGMEYVALVSVGTEALGCLVALWLMKK